MNACARAGSKRTKMLAAGLACMVSLAAVAEAGRQLGTIGPPPRQSPQRQTSAEGLPPLPLPAVPLRRSEPKAEPKAPTFVARLAYGEDQDYMPNPGDLDNLLRHVRTQLDSWYGKTVIKIDELAAAYEQGKKVEVPMLYMVGYESFEFSDAQRAALREYLLDGGTLVANAALGSPEFIKSFTAEMRKVFPRREFDRLQVDHPAFRGYYPYDNVGYFSVHEGARSKNAGPPHMMGINLAARTAVIFSPYDMTCGWDEFFAPPAPRRGERKPQTTKAMMPGDAIRMGVNLVAYTAAQQQFARTQAQTRQIAGAQPQQRAALHVGLLQHHGDWNPDPNALYQLIRLASLRTSVPVAYEIREVRAAASDIAETPILIMTGMDEPRLSEGEVAVLRRHLKAGGFLFINNTSGFAKFDRSARALIDAVAGEGELKKLPADHAVFKSLYEIDQVAHAYSGKTSEPALEAVTIDDRAAIIYSPNDTLGMIKGVHDPYANAYDADSARKLALNILCYALKQ